MSFCSIVSALLRSSVCLFHHVQYLCGGKSGSSSFMLTAVLSALFEVVRLFISIKDPFILAAVSRAKFSSYFNSVNVGEFYQLQWSRLNIYPVIEQQHELVRRVCCLSGSCLSVDCCMTDGLQEVDIIA